MSNPFLRDDDEELSTGDSLVDLHNAMDGFPTTKTEAIIAKHSQSSPTNNHDFEVNTVGGAACRKCGQFQTIPGTPCPAAGRLENASNNLKEQFNEFWEDYGLENWDNKDEATTDAINLILDTILASEAMQDDSITGMRYHSHEAFERETYGPSRNKLRADLRAMLEGLRNG